MSTFRRLLHTLLSLSLLATLMAWPRAVPVARAAGTISGIVYQDYNGNGVRDQATTTANSGTGSIGGAFDNGVADVLVTAYDAADTNQGSDLSDPITGVYTITVGGTGPYRVEFTNLPAGYEPAPFDNDPLVPGEQNGTTVRFVPDGVSTNIDLGINYPADYCQDNPGLATSCYFFGNQITGPNNTRAALISFPYSSGSDSFTNVDQPTTHALSIQANRLGATWGIDWAPSTRRLYVAALMKKHAGFGPGADAAANTADDPGAIYVVNPQGNTVSTVFTVPNATTNAHDTTDYVFDNFDTAWNAVGKTSLGGLALSDDDSTLYVMNLQDRALYALNAGSGAVIISQTVPLNPPLLPPAPVANCPAADVRPFAVTFYRGQLYVGLVCSAESSQDFNQLQAFVYRANPATLAFDAAPAFQFRLDYTRALAEIPSNTPGIWRPWTGNFVPTVSPNPTLMIYPQPWLTDITFDNGNLILGLRDRLGDIAGANTFEDPANPGDATQGMTTGDTLRACGSPTTGWTLENNARCGTPPIGSGPINSGQGPGNGEYYFDDGYTIYHNDTSLGGLLNVPGFPDVAIAAMDPIFNPPTPDDGIYDTGVRWLRNNTGAFVKSYRLIDGDFQPYPGEPSFGKAAGLGDLVALCDAAPIEIGNFVWLDTDKDGAQDPGELPIPGVTVNLYDQNGTLLATAVTNGQGQYYFSSATGTTNAFARYGIAGLTPNTAGFSVRLDNAADYTTGPLVGLSPTLVDSANDSRDSDGLLVLGFPRTTFSTGGPGANNHTYDFGFATNPTAAQLLFFRIQQVTSSGVTVEWATAAEVDTAGFALYRAPAADFGQATPVHYAPAARVPGGSRYVFIDTPAGPGPWWYWLEAISTGGIPERYPPITTAAGSLSRPYAVYLAVVRR